MNMAAAKKQPKKQPEPEGLTPDMIETVATIAADVLGNIRTGEVPGPINLQALWCDVVKAHIASGVDPAPATCSASAPRTRADEAVATADLVVDAFKTRAAKLAEDTAGLAYFDPDADGEPET